MSHRPKICVISSPGGHLTEVLTLRPAYADYDHFFILNDRVPLTDEMRERTLFIRHSERDWLFVANLWEAWRILRRERPTLLLSTGAGAIVPFSIVGKLLGIRSIYVETIARISRPSLTGRLMYRLADRFLYQWKPLQRFFPRAEYGGPLL